MSAENIVVRELERVPERIVDVGLGSKMHNRINVLFPENICDQIRGRNIALYELIVRQAGNLFEVGYAGAVVKAVKVDDVVLWVVLAEADNNMGCNETCRGMDLARRCLVGELAFVCVSSREDFDGFRVIQMDSWSGGQHCLISLPPRHGREAMWQRKKSISNALQVELSV